MADKKITINATPSKVKTISVNKATVANEITATPDTSLYNSNLSKQWATKLDGKVVGEDYSSKYYAEKAKLSAEIAKMEVASASGIIPQLQDNFNNYNIILNETTDNAITEINSTATQAIANVNTTKTEAISTIENKANGLADIDLSNLSETGLAFLKENSGGGGSGFSLFDTRTLDYELPFEQSEGWALQGTYVYKNSVTGSRYGYPDFYAECVNQKNNATATETTLGNNTIIMYINGNGHQFYDIADKDVVDNFYNTMGMAWFYGVDTENERIFLPRNKYFAINGTTNSIPVIGNGLALGMTNGTNNYTLTGRSEYDALIPGNSGVGQPYGSSTGNANTLRGKTLGVIQDAEKSGLVAKTSNILTPDENKYLYICVGNTNVQSSVTNITEITTSENDTLPLFHNLYSKEDMTATGAYVNASLGSFLSGNVYTTAYNELVKKLGTDNVKSITDEYTDYDFVVNQDEMTFRLPLLNGEESIISDRYIDLEYTGDGVYSPAPANGWYYLSKFSSASGQWVVLENTSNNLSSGFNVNGSGQLPKVFVEVAKGDAINVSCSLGGNTDAFRFIYAKGDGNLYYKVANAVENIEVLDVAKVTADLNTCYKRNTGDNSDLSGLAMPSNKYIQLTRGASGTRYTAPANGYFMQAGTFGTTAGYVLLNNLNSRVVTQSYGGNSINSHTFIPVKKGDVVIATYANTTSGSIYFIYAEGEV